MKCKTQETLKAGPVIYSYLFIYLFIYLPYLLIYSFTYLFINTKNYNKILIERSKREKPHGICYDPAKRDLIDITLFVNNSVNKMAWAKIGKGIFSSKFHSFSRIEILIKSFGTP